MDKPSFAEAKAAHAAKWGHRPRVRRRGVPPSPEVATHAAALGDTLEPWGPTWRTPGAW